MTVLQERRPVAPAWQGAGTAGSPPVTRRGRRGAGYGRPGPSGPAVRPLAYRGQGLPVSRAPHARRRVSVAATAGLAGLAALVTLALGLVANLSGGPSTATPADAERLAVVRVGVGESLQQLAGRIAPDAPTGPVVARIRELNKLETSSVLAGQTLIAPVG